MMYYTQYRLREVANLDRRHQTEKRLSESGLPWIEVKGKKHLALIETYGSVNKSSSP